MIGGSAAHRRHHAESWAVAALDRAMGQSAVAGTAVWVSLLGILVAGSASDATSRLALLVVHAGCVAAAVAAFRAEARHGDGGARWRCVAMSTMVTAVAADLAVAGSQLALVAVAMSAVLIATPALVTGRRPAAGIVGLGLAAVVCAAVAGAAAGHVVLAIVATTLCFAVAAGFLREVLLRFAVAVDAEDAEAVLEGERLLAERAAARARAQHAMVLHDTVVNTLGAVASGADSARDARRVADRCRRDLRALDGLTGSGDETQRPLWEGLGLGLPITVQWDGDEPGLGAARSVTRARAGVVRSVLRELLLNADKHSGADVVRVRVSQREEGILEIVVSDAGRGVPPESPAAGRLRESLGRRVGPDSDVEVVLDESAHVGTSVRIRVPTGSGDREPGPASDLERNARRMRRVSTWGWCVGVLGAGLASSVVGGAGPATVASLGLVAGVCGLVWLVCGRDRPAPRRVAVTVVAAVPVAYLLGFVGVSAGQIDAVYWPGIGLTPLFVIALNVVESRRCVGASALALVAAALVAAASVAERTPVVAAIALVNAAVNLAQVTVWVIFVAVLARLTRHGVEARVRRLREREERAAREASTEVLRWWRDAQVEASLALVQELADGTVDLEDAAVRRRAQVEEHHLRQLLLLSPQLVHLGPWLGRCVGHGRERGLLVTVRVGDQDVTDAAAAHRVGRALLAIIDQVRPASSIVVAFFASLDAERCRLTVVGPRDFVAAASLPEHARLEVMVDQDLVVVEA